MRDGLAGAAGRPGGRRDPGHLGQVADWRTLRAPHKTMAPVQHLVFTYNKPAKFRFNKVRGETVTLSGIFFDSTP